MAKSFSSIRKKNELKYLFVYKHCNNHKYKVSNQTQNSDSEKHTIKILIRYSIMMVYVCCVVPQYHVSNTSAPILLQIENRVGV